MKSIISISLDVDLVERMQLEGIKNVSEFVSDLITDALSGSGGYKKKRAMKEINQRLEQFNEEFDLNLVLRVEEKQK